MRSPLRHGRNTPWPLRLTAGVTSLAVALLTSLPVLPSIAAAAAEETTTYIGKYYEIRPDGTTIKYIYAGDQLIAAIVKSPSGAQSIQYVHGDHLGSTNVVTSESGTVLARAEYRPFGSTSQEEGSSSVPHKFTGQRLDSIGLYYYTANNTAYGRYYDPELGSFTQPDSIVPTPGNPQALNHYAYVRNNPVNYTDPSGHFFFLAFLGAVLAKAAIGAAVGAALNATVAAFTGGNVGKAALVGAVGGAIFGAGGAITGLSAFQGATTAAIVGRATVMGTAGALAGLSGAGMTGQPLGRGAGIGAVLGVLGVVAPTPNVPWLGYSPLAEQVNPVLNSMLTGAVLGGGIAAIQGENIGRGALGGAIYTGLGTAFQIGAQSLFPPSNAGFAEDPTSFTLQRGTVLSRIGDTNGRYLAPVGTTVEERALPIYARNRPYHVYEVRKEFEVDMGKAASAYGQSGQGIQYRSERTVQQLIDEGYLALADPRK